MCRRGGERRRSCGTRRRRSWGWVMAGWQMPKGVYSMTPDQRDCLQLICEWVDSYGYPPSYREIAHEMTLGGGTRHARELVTGLVERGWLARAPGLHRGLTILHRPPMPDFSTPEFRLAESA